MQNELYHHGVLGQKWGVRKERTKSKRQIKREAADKIEKTKRVHKKIYSVASNVGYSISAVGSVAGLAVGNPLVISGSAFVGNAIVAGATAASIAATTKNGMTYVNTKILTN